MGEGNNHVHGVNGGGGGQSSSRPSVFTIGHSNGSLEHLIQLLCEHRVEVLVDTRSHPYSRFFPHFSRDSLKNAVRVAGFRYLYMGDSLGGRPTDRTCYDAEGKVLYDKIEEQEFYKRGIERVMDGIGRYRVCLLCSEEDPIKCHRRLLIVRTLRRRDVEPRHIRGDGRIETELEVEGRYRQTTPQFRLL